ncbi:pilus assembly protein PilX [Piscinibacter sakaiensis]|uniref:pilus assembly PilX family protein n=1 Tax=Piscinibacter sakaiensis TaxID=1547922 RepID=UPI0012FB3106|nr:pilus assembly protein PilX [Piscinibacter sakaiensis]
MPVVLSRSLDRSPAGRRARGVSLIFALLALTAMSLAAVALVRSVDTSSLVVGNLGFRQDGVQYSSRAAETAITWLRQNLSGSPTVLNGDSGDDGYYATALATLDPTGRSTTNTRVVVDWAGNNCADYASGSFAACVVPENLPRDATSRNTSAYVITRLCTAKLAPSDSANSCARGLTSSVSEGGEKGEVNYNRQRGSVVTDAGPYYRIVVRTTGPRDTVSYTETIIHF